MTERRRRITLRREEERKKFQKRAPPKREETNVIISGAVGKTVVPQQYWSIRVDTGIVQLPVLKGESIPEAYARLWEIIDQELEKKIAEEMAKPLKGKSGSKQTKRKQNARPNLSNYTESELLQEINRRQQRGRQMSSDPRR